MSSTIEPSLKTTEYPRVEVRIPQRKKSPNYTPFDKGTSSK